MHLHFSTLFMSVLASNSIQYKFFMRLLTEAIQSEVYGLKLYTIFTLSIRTDRPEKKKKQYRPEQTLQNATSAHGLHCLPLYASTNGKIDV